MKQITIPCDFDGKKFPFSFYVGSPRPDMHPLTFQKKWLSSRRGGMLPQEVSDSFEKLHTISKEYTFEYDELVAYAMNGAEEVLEENILTQINAVVDDRVISFEWKEAKKKIEDAANAKEEKEKTKARRKKEKDPYTSFVYGKTRKEDYHSILKLAELFFPNEDLTSRQCRAAFFAVGCYLYHTEEKNHVSLPGLYKVFATDNVDYSLHVVLDTIGGKLPRFIFDLIAALIEAEENCTNTCGIVRQQLIYFCFEDHVSTKNMKLLKYQQDLSKHLIIK